MMEMGIPAVTIQSVIEDAEYVQSKFEAEERIVIMLLQFTN